MVARHYDPATGTWRGRHAVEVAPHTTRGSAGGGQTHGDDANRWCEAPDDGGSAQVSGVDASDSAIAVFLSRPPSPAGPPVHRAGPYVAIAVCAVFAVHALSLLAGDGCSTPASLPSSLSSSPRAPPLTPTVPGLFLPGQLATPTTDDDGAARRWSRSGSGSG
eukprot:gene18062-48618_t